MNIHGKGKGKGAGGDEHIDVSVPGFNAIITTGGGYLGDIIEYVLFAVFVYYLYCKIMEATTTCSSIMAFTAPIIRYGRLASRMVLPSLTPGSTSSATALLLTRSASDRV